MNTPVLSAAPPVEELSSLSTVRGIEQRVENILKARKLTTKWLYERIGMSKTGFRQMWSNDSIKVAVLLDIAEALRVEVNELLYATGEQLTVAAQPAPAYTARPRYLEDRVADLERELQNLKAKLKLQ